MGLNALQEIGLVRDMADAEINRVIILETFADGEAEGEIAIGIVRQEGYVFQTVERLGAQFWVGERYPVFFPAVGHDDGPRLRDDGRVRRGVLRAEHERAGIAQHREGLRGKLWRDFDEGEFQPKLLSPRDAL